MVTVTDTVSVRVPAGAEGQCYWSSQENWTIQRYSGVFFYIFYIILLNSFFSCGSLLTFIMNQTQLSAVALHIWCDLLKLKWPFLSSLYEQFTNTIINTLFITPVMSIKRPNKSKTFENTISICEHKKSTRCCLWCWLQIVRDKAEEPEKNLKNYKITLTFNL